jgi:WD40 repeat protein
VILYELLTGSTPIARESIRQAAMDETLRVIREVEPPTPSSRISTSEALPSLAATRQVEPARLSRLVRGDLDWIVMKALAKERERRYDSAIGLGNDLERFLNHEPVSAGSPTAAYRLRKFLRKHRSRVIAASLVLLVLLGGIVGTSIGMLQAREAETKRAEGEKWAKESETVQRTEAEKAREEAQKQERIALNKAEQLAREDYVNRVNRAYREVKDDNVALAHDSLHGCDPGRRGWEWFFVKRLCNSERRVLELGNRSVNALAYGPDGSWAVSGSGAETFGPRPIPLAPSVDVWEVSSGERRKTLAGAKGTVYAVAVSPDGKKVAAGCSDGLVLVWDVEAGQGAWTRSDAGLSAMSVTFSPDSKSLAVGYGSYSDEQIGRAKVWDVASGKELKAFTGPKGGVNKVAFHPGGKRLALAGSEVVQVWDLATGGKLQDLKGHAKWIYCLAYSPDGKWLATGGWDRTVKLRDAATGAEALTIFAHEGFVLNLAFSPDGRTLATTSEDRSVRLWDVPSGRRSATFHGHSDFVSAISFRPDGREIATGSVDGSIRFWDLQTSRPVVVGHTGWVTRFAFRRDGLRVISDTGGYRETDAVPTKSWNLVTGELDATLAGINFESLPAEYVRGPLGYFERFLSKHFDVTSPDGKLIAQTRDLTGASVPSRSKDYAYSSVVVREMQTGRVIHTLTGHSSDVTSLAFSPDGRRLATASFDRTVKVWDMQTGQEVFTLIGHTAGVAAVAFSPDGNQIVSGGIDNSARVWNATPLATDVTAEHDARYRKKIETLTQLKAATDDLERA